MPRLLVLALLLGLASPDVRAQSGTPPAVVLPDSSRPWSPQDFQDAVTALGSAAPGTLPQKGTGAAGAAFNRLVSLDNLAALNNPETPLPTRLAMSLEFADGAGKMLAIYHAAFNKGENLGPEVLALSAYVCEVVAAEWTLVDLFAQTLDPKAPDYATRMKGLDRMREGTATVISALLVTLTETSAYGKEALTAFAGQIRTTFPTLMRHAPELSQSTLGLRLEGQMKAEPAGPYRAALEALVVAVKPTGQGATEQQR